MNRIPNWLKWLVVALVFALMGAAVLAVDRRASRVDMPDLVPRGIPGGRNFCPAYAGRNGFPLERGAFATR